MRTNTKLEPRTARPRARGRLRWTFHIALHHGQFDRGESLSGYSSQPILWQSQRREQFGIRRIKLRAAGQALHQGVAGKFRVALPPQRAALQPQAQKMVLHVRDLKSFLSGEFAKMPVLLFKGDSLTQHRNPHYQRR